MQTAKAAPGPDVKVDHRWLAEYAFALYSGTETERRDTTGEIPVLPGWYSWRLLQRLGYL